MSVLLCWLSRCFFSEGEQITCSLLLCKRGKVGGGGMFLALVSSRLFRTPKADVLCEAISVRLTTGRHYSATPQKTYLMGWCLMPHDSVLELFILSFFVLNTGSRLWHWHFLLYRNLCTTVQVPVLLFTLIWTGGSSTTSVTAMIFPLFCPLVFLFHLFLFFSGVLTKQTGHSLWPSLYTASYIFLFLNLVLKLTLPDVSLCFIPCYASRITRNCLLV